MSRCLCGSLRISPALSIDEKTRVFVGVAGPERTLPTGNKVRQTRYTRGQLSDLKAGQQVLLLATSAHADRINIHPPEAPPSDGL